MSRKFLIPILAFLLLDLLAIGAGMGVPFFPILFGFIVGWVAPPIILPDTSDLRHSLKACLSLACLTSCFTLLVMLLIWGPFASMLLNPAADFVNFGIPMILYDPKASFIGWLILMIFISPALQALTTVFAAVTRLAWRMPRSLQQSSNLAQ
ncbi:MAG TPA: hypothetical protein VMC62_10345 [Longilinea sp.]|nr:hypothetical protein [Longilinea sp.]